MKKLSSKKKIYIVLSLLWLLIAIAIVDAQTRHGMPVRQYIGLSLFYSLPVWLPWTIYWIWGTVPFTKIGGAFSLKKRSKGTTRNTGVSNTKERTKLKQRLDFVVLWLVIVCVVPILTIAAALVIGTEKSILNSLRDLLTVENLDIIREKFSSSAAKNMVWAAICWLICYSTLGKIYKKQLPVLAKWHTFFIVWMVSTIPTYWNSISGVQDINPFSYVVMPCSAVPVLMYFFLKEKPQQIQG